MNYYKIYKTKRDKRMSEQELIEYIQNNLENSPIIDPDTGISAIKKSAKIAAGAGGFSLKQSLVKLTKI